jgi:hypothetical protein
MWKLKERRQNDTSVSSARLVDLLGWVRLEGTGLEMKTLEMVVTH